MRRWSILASALLAAVAMVAVTDYARRVAPATAGEVSRPLRDRLTTRVVAALEHDPTWRTEATRDPGWHPLCMATVFGIAPKGANTVEDVGTVYAWVGCRWFGPAALDADELPAATVPMALRLGPPLTYRVPTDGEEYPASLRRIFPARLRAEAAGQRPDPAFRDAMAALDRRVAAAVAAARPSPSK